MRPVLPPLEEYAAVPSFMERAPLDAFTIRALWHEHMSGSPVRMDEEALRMRRWMRTDRDGVLTPDEETALHRPPRPGCSSSPSAAPGMDDLFVESPVIALRETSLPSALAS